MTTKADKLDKIRVVPSGKVYRQLFEAEVEIFTLCLWKAQLSFDNKFQGSTGQRLQKCQRPNKGKPTTPTRAH
jgi:hypothetical protein